MLKGGQQTPSPHRRMESAAEERGFVIYVEVERHRGLATVLVDKAVPAYTWTEEIIRDHLERDIPEVAQMVILSPHGLYIL